MKIADFVYDSISDAKVVLERVGFRHVKIIDFNITRDKIYRYFNNLSGLLELVLRDEIERCYRYIDQMTLHAPIQEKPLISLYRYRSQYIERTKLLKTFYRDRQYLPAKLKGLKKEIEGMEKIKRLNYLVNSEKQRINGRLNNRNGFLMSILFEIYVIKNGSSLMRSSNFMF